MCCLVETKSWKKNMNDMTKKKKKKKKKFHSNVIFKKKKNKVKILGIDVDESNLKTAREFGDSSTDFFQSVNAQSVADVLTFVNKHTNGIGADLVVSCVNVPSKIVSNM
jgi:Zn-dependent alcohol dehydrogenase